MVAKSKCVLVTGVAGFIGSNLSRVLLERGYSVIGIDNLSNGFERNIERYLHDPRFTFIRADITQPETFKDISGVDYAVHLAAYKIPRYGNILDTLQINLQGTENVLDFVRRENSKLVFASTSDVYGKNPTLPFKETDNLVLGNSGVARWAYAVSKVYDEHLCFAHIEKYKTRLTILRYFGGYGPNQNTSWWGGPQSVFIGAILAGQPMEIHGDGLQTRSFTYIDDLVDGTLRAMENKNANGEIFNLGDTREITILHLSELIWKLMKGDRPIERKFVPYATFFGGKYEDVRRRVPDIAKAKERLGFEPKMNLEKGLRIAIAWQTQISKASKDREVGGGD
jgi:nucleoside-diphosphate-sugar epimerase